MKNSIKRAQSQVRLSFAERENQRSLAGGESNFRPKVRQLKKTLLTLVALLAVTTGAWATEFTSLKVGDVLHVGDVINTSTNYTVCEAYLDAGIQPATVVRANIGIDDITESETGAYYLIKGNNDFYYGIIWGEVYEGGYWPVTDTSDGIVVTAITPGGYTELTFAVHEGSASADKVAWDKDKMSGTFTMPGGNVTLEPEYYPQAALTAQPTAIDDVPATTDGAIVKAGTVKNIGETETAQGTVMYYVSPSALDDAALLALAADAWKADVPTAESLAQGQAYVYYYVRGNDSDNDDENFSDGDILAANALTVTIAAEPLYNAEFELTNAPEEDKAPGVWTTDIPEGGVVKGTPVTVTYTGSKKVIGVKAEKKAKAPTTVTWNSPNFQGTTYTQDGVTLTPSSGDGAFSNALYEYGENTFTTTLGKFTKIEIVCTGNNLDGWTKETAGKFQPNPDGDPDYWKDLYKMTWTGNAESVTLKEKYVYEIQSITFTIQ